MISLRSERLLAHFLQTTEGILSELKVKLFKHEDQNKG